MEAEDVFIEDGEWNEAKLRGAFKKWKETEEFEEGEFDSIYEGNIPSVAYHKASEWIGDNFSGWFPVKMEYGRDTPSDVFKEYWENDDEFREYLSQFGSATGTDSDESHNEEEEVEEDDEEVSEADPYKKLIDIGIMESDRSINWGKVKGAMLKYSRDVDEIIGTKPAPDTDDIHDSFNIWSKDKFGDCWMDFMMDQAPYGNISQRVEWMWENNDEFKENVEDKWSYDPEVLEGNGNESGTEDDGIDEWAEREGVETDNDNNDKNGKSGLGKFEEVPDEFISDEEDNDGGRRGAQKTGDKLTDYKGHDNARGWSDSNDKGNTNRGQGGKDIGEASRKGSKEGRKEGKEGTLEGFASQERDREEVIVVDLYCAAGGVGYTLDRNGVDTIGVDKKDKSSTYPGKFIQGDASDLELVGSICEAARRSYDKVIVWLSPPCKAYSKVTNVNVDNPKEVHPTFDDLNVYEVIDSFNWDDYILENVYTCDDFRKDTAVLNGFAFGKDYNLKRRFETSFRLPSKRANQGSNDSIDWETKGENELAEEKGIPRSWGKEDIRNAMPPEYVEYIFSHIDYVNIDEPKIDNDDPERLSSYESNAKNNEYDIEVNSLFEGDAIDMLRAMKNEGIKADALITDPPYGLDYAARDNESRIEGDADVDEAMSLVENVIKLSRIVLRDGSPVILFCGDVNLAETVRMVKEHLEFEQILVWDKKHIGLGALGGDDGRAPRWRPKHEFVVFGGYGYMEFENDNRHDGSILEFQKLHHDDMDHPTEKPLEMMRYIIESVTEEEDTVMDPFAGSGSTLVSAKSCNRNYIGAEIDEEHQETINNRLRQSVLV